MAVIMMMDQKHVSNHSEINSYTFLRPFVFPPAFKTAVESKVMPTVSASSSID